MATLQNIRSKGPLLVIVIGLALFAFIAGDAWKLIERHVSGPQSAGEVDGESLSLQDYQSMVEEYTEFFKMTRGMEAVTDELSDQIKDFVWETYVSNKLLENEAEKLGLAVTDAEIQAVVRAGVHPLLRQMPLFVNRQTGTLDSDALQEFLANYAKMDKRQMPDEYVRIYNVWNFIEKTLRQTLLQSKYQALIAKAVSSNPVEAQASFDGRINQMDMLLAAVPYVSVSDTLVKVTDADLKAAYDKKKEMFRQTVETRNIRYIDVQVTASEEDKAELQKEMEEYTEQLAALPSDYTTFIRSTGSEASYVDLFCTTNAFPTDVVSRLDSVAIGEVYGPYYNVSDNTLTSFKKVAKASMADSIQYRQIQVIATPERLKTLADSIYTALKGGADFAEMAKKYGQTGEPVWIASAYYEGAQLDGDNLKYINTLTSLGQKELANLELGQGNIIIEVLDKKAMKDKYKLAVIKRKVDFSKETYNKAYNDFSAFIATNNTLEKVVANAENAGYRLLSKDNLMSSEHGIGGVRGTKEALRWIFEKASVGDVSGLYECGENDHMMVVALAGVVPEGYRPLSLVKEELRFEVLRDKKAEKIMADMQAAGATTFAQYAALPNAVSDSVKHVTFSAPAYVTALRSSEPLVSAYVPAAQVGQLSTPIKGNAAVFVLQPYASEKQEGTFDKDAEETSLVARYSRVLGQCISDLARKANVKDHRYLYF